MLRLLGVWVFRLWSVAGYLLLANGDEILARIWLQMLASLYGMIIPKIQFGYNIHQIVMVITMCH